MPFDMKPMAKWTWIVAIAASAAIMGQTILIREGLVLFSGNELVMGFLLWLWLAGAGLGSYCWTRYNLRADPVAVFERLLLLLAASLCLSVLFFRLAAGWFGLTRGEVAPLGRIVFMALVGIVPTSVLFGVAFPAAARLLPPSRVYMFEAAGAAAGGLLFSFLLAPRASAVSALAVAASLLLAARALIKPSFFRGLVGFLPLTALVFSQPVELALRQQQWGRHNLRAVLETRYGVYGFFQSGEQWNFYDNGRYNFSYPDRATAEDAVHYPLLLHPQPGRVLLVGGTLAGTGPEIRRHPTVKMLVGAELDPVFYRWARSRLGLPAGTATFDSMVFGDSRFHLRRRRSAYDVIIVNLPDPVNGQLNRFYTQDFFLEARRALAPGGILSVRISAPPDIISPAVAAYVQTVQSALRTAFGNALVLPASRIVLAACRADTVFNRDSLSAVLARRLAQRQLDTRYVTSSLINHGLTPEKLLYLETVLRQTPGRKNEDLKPACYFYALTVWSGINADWLRKIFIAASRLPVVALFSPLVLVFIFFRRRSAVACAVFVNGLTAFSLCLITAVLFQVNYGYVYGWLALLSASFMAGLAAGAWISPRRIDTKSLSSLALLDALSAVLIGFLILVAALHLPGGQYYLPGVMMLAGWHNGIYFCLALATAEVAPGRLYALDLAGASLAALCLTMLLIPLAGIMPVLMVLAAIRLLMAAGLCFWREAD